jgi:hypothetical protein
MKNWYLYAKKFEEISIINTNTYLTPFTLFKIDDSNLCYVVANVIREYKDTYLLYLSHEIDRRYYRFNIYHIRSKLTEEETYNQTRDLYEYIRFKYNT